jgi:hypothetical protein
MLAHPISTFYTDSLADIPVIPLVLNAKLNSDKISLFSLIQPEIAFWSAHTGNGPHGLIHCLDYEQSRSSSRPEFLSSSFIPRALDANTDIIAFDNPEIMVYNNPKPEYAKLFPNWKKPVPDLEKTRLNAAVHLFQENSSRIMNNKLSNSDSNSNPFPLIYTIERIKNDLHNHGVLSTDEKELTAVVSEQNRLDELIRNSHPNLSIVNIFSSNNNESFWKRPDGYAALLTEIQSIVLYNYQMELYSYRSVRYHPVFMLCHENSSIPKLFEPCVAFLTFYLNWFLKSTAIEPTPSAQFFGADCIHLIDSTLEMAQTVINLFYDHPTQTQMGDAPMDMFDHFHAHFCEPIFSGLGNTFEAFYYYLKTGILQTKTSILNHTSPKEYIKDKSDSKDSVSSDVYRMYKAIFTNRNYCQIMDGKLKCKYSRPCLCPHVGKQTLIIQFEIRNNVPKPEIVQTNHSSIKRVKLIPNSTLNQL